LNRGSSPLPLMSRLNFCWRSFKRHSRDVRVRSFQ